MLDSGTAKIVCQLRSIAVIKLNTPPASSRKEPLPDYSSVKHAKVPVRAHIPLLEAGQMTAYRSCDLVYAMLIKTIAQIKQEPKSELTLRQAELICRMYPAIDNVCLRRNRLDAASSAIKQPGIIRASVFKAEARKKLCKF